MARKKFTTTLDEDLIRRLKIRSLEEDTDANKIIERLVSKYLNKKPKE